jgi:hypothetical protein
VSIAIYLIATIFYDTAHNCINTARLILWSWSTTVVKVRVEKGPGSRENKPQAKEKAWEKEGGGG